MWGNSDAFTWLVCVVSVVYYTVAVFAVFSFTTRPPVATNSWRQVQCSCTRCSLAAPLPGSDSSSSLPVTTSTTRWRRWSLFSVAILLSSTARSRRQDTQHCTGPVAAATLWVIITFPRLQLRCCQQVAHRLLQNVCVCCVVWCVCVCWGGGKFECQMLNFIFERKTGTNRIPFKQSQAFLLTVKKEQCIAWHGCVYAEVCMFQDIVRLLLENGANIDAKNNFRCSPIYMAVEGLQRRICHVSIHQCTIFHLL